MLTPTRWFGIGTRSKRVGVNALHLGDGHLALGHEHLDGRGCKPDVERGADCAHGDTVGRNDERSRGIVGDGEMSFALHECHAALMRQQLDAHLGVGVKLDDRAVGEHDALIAAGGCRVVECSG